MKSHLVVLALIAFFLLVPTTVKASVLGIRGYSNPSGGQDRFQFDVYVSSQDDYPECSVVARYNDGTPEYRTRGVASFSTNIKPSKPSTIYVTCESVTASTAFAGNSYPFAGDVMRVVGNPPVSSVKATPASAPTQKPVSVSTTPVPSAQVSSNPAIITPNKVINWTSTIAGSIKRFLIFIGNFWRK